MPIEKDFQQAKNLIDQSNNILLTMHERMDGDDGGSVLALAQIFKTQGKNVTVSIKKGVPPNLDFLPGSQYILDDISHEDFSAKGGSQPKADQPLAGAINSGGDFDLLITCGCSEIKRTGSENIAKLLITNNQLPVINIDHHPDNSLFGQVNIVDHTKSSVAELIYDFFIFNRWKITKEIATCLLTGIITDTGGFMHSNTKESTLKAAAELMRKGALVDKIFKHTFNSKSPRTLRAWGKAMENSYYDSKQQIIYSVITEKDLNEIGDLPQAAFEGFTETLNKIPEAKFAMFLRQDGEIIKGSLRSETFKNVDVSQIAKTFGGGGHKLAAGFSVAGKLMKDEAGKWQVV